MINEVCIHYWGVHSQIHMLIETLHYDLINYNETHLLSIIVTESNTWHKKLDLIKNELFCLL